MNLHGLRILGELDAAQAAIDRLKRRRQAPQRFIIAPISSASGDSRRRLLRISRMAAPRRRGSDPVPSFNCGSPFLSGSRLRYPAGAIHGRAMPDRHFASAFGLTTL